MEHNPDSHHGMRAARQNAVRGNEDVASVLASWKITPKPELPLIEEPKLKENPAIESDAERLRLLKIALDVAVRHMHQAEAHRTPRVAGMKTYGIAIMTEVFGLDAKGVAQDSGALSDLVEYLTDMVHAVNRADVRSPRFDPSTVQDEDVQLVHRLRNTWELPDNEFGPPSMYQRVDWQKVNPAEGN